jgi:hypothetical protein
VNKGFRFFILDYGIIETFAGVKKEMKKVVHKAKNFKEAEEWDILQQINMTPEERQNIALELRRRVYGKKSPDLREVHQRK